MLSHTWLCTTSWAIISHVPLFKAFSRQEYRSGLLFPTPGDLFTQGSNPCLLHLLHWQGDSLSLALHGKPSDSETMYNILRIVQVFLNRHIILHKRSTSRLYIVTCLFNLYAEYIMRNAGLEETQAGTKIAGRNISYADDTTLMAESEDELKASWWKWKRRVKTLA